MKYNIIPIWTIPLLIYVGGVIYFFYEGIRPPKFFSIYVKQNHPKPKLRELIKSFLWALIWPLVLIVSIIRNRL